MLLRRLLAVWVFHSLSRMGQEFQGSVVNSFRNEIFVNSYKKNLNRFVTANVKYKMAHLIIFLSNISLAYFVKTSFFFIIHNN